MGDDRTKGIVDAFFLIGPSALLTTLHAIVRKKVVAVVLGATGVGILSQNWLLVSLLVNLGMLGLGTAIIKYVSEYAAREAHQEADRLLSTSLYLVLILSIGCALGLVAGASTLATYLFDRDGYRHLILITAAGTPAYILARFFECVANGQKRIRLIAFSTSLAMLAGMAIVYPLVRRMAEAGAMLSLVVSSSLALTVYVFAYAGSPRQNAWRLLDPRRIDLRVLPGLFRFGAANLSRDVAVYVALLLVRSLIVQRLGPEANGIFDPASAISLHISTVFLALVVYYLPSVSGAGDERAVRQELNETTRIGVLLTVPIVLVVSVFRYPFVALFYTEGFYEASGYLSRMLIGKPFELLNLLMLFTFIGTRRLRALLVFELSRSALYVLMSWAAFPLLNLDAVVAAYLVSHVAAFALGVVLLKRALHVSFSIGNAILFAKALLPIAVLAAVGLRSAIESVVGLAAVFLWWYLAIGFRDYRDIVGLYVARRHSQRTT